MKKCISNQANKYQIQSSHIQLLVREERQTDTKLVGMQPAILPHENRDKGKQSC